MFRIRRKKRVGVRGRWQLPALMCCACGLLALALVLGLMELGTTPRQEPAPESASSAAAPEAQQEESSPAPAALRKDASLDSAPESQPEDLSEAPQTFALAISSESEDDVALTETDAAAILNSLRDVFPEGMYWNHMGVEDWDEFTVTDTPCDHDYYWDTYCNGYSGATQELFPQFLPMEQCLGFAALLSDLVFGEEAPVSTFTDYTQLRVGDHIRLELSEHSMTVLSVDSDGITVVECNSDYEHCRISWDRFLGWDDLAAYSYEMECITRY